MAHQQPLDFGIPLRLHMAIQASNVPAEEAPRLSGQCAAILARLQLAPASNYDLACIALKYTSRISDLRHAGYKISVASRDHKSGYVVYHLEAKR